MPRKHTPALPGGADLEGPVKLSVVAALTLRGALCWTANAGTILLPGRCFRGNPPGTPDVVGVLPIRVWGRRRPLFFGVETKRPKGGQLEQSQIEWRDKMREAGVLWGVARSAQEAVDLYDGWVRELENERKTAEK